MAIIILCPSCQAQLHLPEEYVGRKVRCASCNSMFDGPPPSLVNRPAAADPVIDLPLDLCLDNPGTPPSEPPARPPARLVGAVELNLSLDDEREEPRNGLPPPEVPIPVEIPQEKPPTRQPEDMVACPSCGTSVHNDSRRCYKCGKRLGKSVVYDEDDLPGQRGRLSEWRRDRMPHRGGAILALGITGLVCLLFCGVVGLGLSITAWVLGAADMNRYARRELDPEGYGPTNAGYICGIVGTVLNVLWLLAAFGFFTFIILEDARPRPYGSPPRFGPVNPRR
jgi:hypothetical protein